MGIRELKICPAVAKHAVTVASNAIFTAPCVQRTRAPPTSQLVYGWVSHDDTPLGFELVESTRCPASVDSTEVI